MIDLSSTLHWAVLPWFRHMETELLVVHILKPVIAENKLVSLLPRGLAATSPVLRP